MSSEYCPKTCGQLSAAAILISVGIIQLLAGIILLNSDIICLLASTDFIASAANVFIGSLLGISASIWEKKKKVESSKNTARQNVLAGLYIAALSSNATTAIIMIMGDGSKLLISSEDAEEKSALVFEVLASAYVISVCSPIICVVIALVCLSGNRIQVHEKMKKPHSITKSESYGWVYDKKVGVRPKNLDELLKQFSANKESPVSDDNVFLEKKSTISGKPSLGKYSESDPKNSISSVREVPTPLEIWDQKRKKLLQEITTPKPLFFSDDYLQFPDFKYGSYAETMLPRVKKSSLIQQSHEYSRTSLKEVDLCKNKTTEVETILSCNPTMPNIDELNSKIAARRMSYPDYILNSKIAETDSPIHNNAVCEMSSDCEVKGRYSVDQVDSIKASKQKTYFKTPPSPTLIDKSKRENSIYKKISLNGYEREYESPLNPYNTVSSTSGQEHYSDYSSGLPRRDSNHSISGLTSQTISELKAKINRLSMNDRSISENKEFMGSFKYGAKKKSNLSESDVGTSHVSISSPTFNSVSSEDCDFNEPKASWAGDIVPISIRPSTKRIDNVQECIENQHFNSPIQDLIENPGLNNDRSISSTAEDIVSNIRSTPFRSLKEKTKRNSPLEYSKCSSVKYSEKKFDLTQRSPFMGSIPESPSEEDIQRHYEIDLKKPLRESLVIIEQSGEILPSETRQADVEKSLTYNSPKRSSKTMSNTSPKSLLNRLWSIKRSDNKVELSSLIMDADSLVGLSDEELLDRTRRMRQIRQSVILRSKDENREGTEKEQGNAL